VDFRCPCEELSSISEAAVLAFRFLPLLAWVFVIASGVVSVVVALSKGIPCPGDRLFPSVESEEFLKTSSFVFEYANRSWVFFRRRSSQC
jgi:hypothetical protein